MGDDHKAGRGFGGKKIRDKGEITGEKFVNERVAF